MNKDLAEDQKARLLASFGDAEAITMTNGMALTYMERENRGYTVAPFKSRVLQITKADKLLPMIEERAKNVSE